MNTEHSPLELNDISNQALFNNLSEALHVVNRELIMLAVNPAFKARNKRIGLPEEVIGWQLKDVFPFLSGKVLEEYQAVFENGETLITRETVPFENEVLYTETHKMAITHDGIIHYVLTLTRDITQEIMAEQQRKNDQALLRSLMDAITETILLVNPDGTIGAMNKTAAERLLSGNNRLGLKIHDVVPFLEEPERKEMVNRVLKTGRALRFDGERGRRTIFHSLYPVMNEAHQVTKVAVFAQDVTELRQKREELQRTLHEKNLLLQELQHRVKNNLSVLISLVDMQTQNLDDETAKKSLLDFKYRIQAMAQVYENLQTSGSLSQIDIHSYLNALLHNLLKAIEISPEVNVTLEAPTLLLDMNRVLACGLIVNELVTNSIKHAFKDSDPSKRPHIFVVYTTGQRHCLTVRDNGSGIAPGFDPLQSDTLGLKLVDILVKYQLDGTLEWRNEKGVVVSISFPPGEKDQGDE